jgi:aminoglycoside phosphotransferase (APT) family kinase protein
MSGAEPDDAPWPALATGTVLDAALARTLVDAQFPQWRSLPIRPVDADGWDNRTFRLGDELSIRLPSGPWYAEQVAKEQEWLPLLAPLLPVPIPEPVAQGEPGDGYPYPWSVYRWRRGTPIALDADVSADVALAEAIGGFLTALRQAPTDGAPRPGRHNFYRGDSPAVYQDEALAAFAVLGADAERAHAVWERATASTWDREPVWFHGDVAPGNLLLAGGALAAVIDFGTSGVGDPACDLVPAWTMFAGAATEAFRASVGLDDATWQRAAGWALWKAAITVRDRPNDRPSWETLGRLLA